MSRMDPTVKRESKCAYAVERASERQLDSKSGYMRPYRRQISQDNAAEKSRARVIDEEAGQSALHISTHRMS